MKKAIIKAKEGVGWLETTEEIYLGEISDQYIEKLTVKLENQGYKVEIYFK